MTVLHNACRSINMAWLPNRLRLLELCISDVFHFDVLDVTSQSCIKLTLSLTSSVCGMTARSAQFKYPSRLSLFRHLLQDDTIISWSVLEERDVHNLLPPMLVARLFLIEATGLASLKLFNIVRIVK